MKIYLVNKEIYSYEKSNENPQYVSLNREAAEAFIKSKQDSYDKIALCYNKYKSTNVTEATDEILSEIRDLFGDTFRNLNKLNCLAVLGNRYAFSRSVFSIQELHVDDGLDIVENPGYHVSMIKKGTLGESSKILEEVHELIDAEKQECKVMALVELSDIVGAIEYYLSNNYDGITMADLGKMSAITQRAFANGRR